MSDGALNEVVLHPQTGEALVVRDADHAELVEAFVVLEQREQQMHAWRVAVEDELVRRYTEARGDGYGSSHAALPVGDWEVELDQGWSRDWDADELMAVVEDLVGRGVLEPRAVTGLVTHVPKVSGTLAGRLLKQLDGDALKDLRGCFRWKQRSRPRVKVTRSVELAPPSPGAGRGALEA